MRKLLAVAASLCGLAAFAEEAANVVIYDEEPENKAVVVPEGKVLEVRGDGLTANCTVEVGVGGKIKFYKNATIAAPITTDGNCEFTTDTSAITGTVAGAWTAMVPTGGAAGIYLDAPGLINFIGGGIISNGTGNAGVGTKSTVWFNGNAQVTNKTFDVYSADKFLQGHFLVANGGKWVHHGQSGAQLTLNESSQSGDAIFEIGKGGYATYGNNEHIYIGNKSYLSKLYINGGTFKIIQRDRIFLNVNGTGNCVIEVDNGGVLDTIRHFKVCNKTGTCKMLLKNGTLSGQNLGYNYDYLFTNYDGGTNRKIDVEIGDDFKIDFSTFATYDIADTINTNQVAVNWTCTPGARLTLIGRDSLNPKLKFTMRGFNANGLYFYFPYSAKPVDLVLADPPSPVELAVEYPLQNNCSLSVTNTAGGATADLKVALDATWQAQLFPDTLAAVFPTFASVSASALNFRTSDTIWSFVSGEVIDQATVITNVSGNLILEKTPAFAVEKLGGNVYCQDDNAKAYTIYNVNHWPCIGGSYAKCWTDHSNSWTTNDTYETEDLISWAYGANCYLYTAPGPDKYKETAFYGDGGFGGEIYVNKLFVKPAYSYMDGQTGNIEIGPGGLEFVESDYWGFIRSAEIDRLILGADQTWTNSAPSGTAYYSTTGNASGHWKARVSARSSVKNWKIAGNLETWLSSPNNQLGSVTVTVVKPAKLRLVNTLDARLNAKKLVLDGSEMGFGELFPLAIPASCGATSSNKHTSNVYIDQDHLGDEVELKNGAKLAIEKATAYDLPVLTVTGAGNEISGAGTLSINCSAPTIAFTDAASELTIGALLGNVEGKTLRVTGAGTLAYEVADADTTPDFDLDGSASLTLTGAGRFAGNVAKAAAITVAGSGIVNVVGAISTYGASSINVTSGTLLLANKDAIPAGVKINTSGEGAFSLIDPTGFDSETMMEGTKNYQALSSPLIVTDVARENETIVVKADETLVIYGSGLKDSSEVIMESGATIRFCNNATEYAPITSTNTINIETIAGVTGTVAGVFIADADAMNHRINLKAPGLLNFIGGGTLKQGGFSRTGYPPLSLYIYGNVQVTNCLFNCNAAFCFKSGHFTVKDNGIWFFVDYNNTTLSQQRADVYMDSPSGDICLEVGKGGLFRVFNNNYFLLGGGTTYEARLYVNGGVFRRDQADWFKIDGKTVVEIDNGGIMATTRELYCNSSNLKGKVLLKNGVWDGDGDYYLQNNQYNLIGGNAGHVDVEIDGDFTFKLGTFGRSSITNTVPGRSTWTATPTSRIHIQGKKNERREFVMRDFEGDNLAISLETAPNTTFVLADATNETVALGYVLPGVSGGKISAIGTSPKLDLSYVVPNGCTYEANTLPGTFEGFEGTAAISNLVFDAGSTLLFPAFAATPAVMAINGAMTLPAAMNYRVTPSGSQKTIADQAIVTPALGFDFTSGTCTWICTGDIARRDACAVATGSNGLTFSYTAPGLTIFIR